MRVPDYQLISVKCIRTSEDRGIFSYLVLCCSDTHFRISWSLDDQYVNRSSDNDYEKTRNDVKFDNKWSIIA